jgi:hypothetical protein
VPGNRIAMAGAVQKGKITGEELKEALDRKSVV